MQDMCVDLEHIEPSSSAFWFLWDLYKSILSNSWFVFGRRPLLRKDPAGFRCFERWLDHEYHGSESQFSISIKNQYEEGIFLMEDERVQLDARICRMRTTLGKRAEVKKHVEASEDPPNFLNRETFPRGILTGP
jgi:hypothetical protein